MTNKKMTNRAELKRKLEHIAERPYEQRYVYNDGRYYHPLELIGEIKGLGKVAHIEQMPFYQVLERVGLHRLVTQKQLFHVAIEAEYPHVGGFTREGIVYPPEYGKRFEIILMRESPILKSLQTAREADVLEHAQLAYSLSTKEYQDVLAQAREDEAKQPEEKRAIILNNFLKIDEGSIGIPISRKDFNSHPVTRMLYGDLVEQVNDVLTKDTADPNGGLYIKTGKTRILGGYDKSIVRQLWTNSNFCYLDGTENWSITTPTCCDMTLLFEADEVIPERLEEVVGDEKDFADIEAIRNTEWYRNQVKLINEGNERIRANCIYLQTLGPNGSGGGPL